MPTLLLFQEKSFYIHWHFSPSGTVPTWLLNCEKSEVI